MKDTRARAKGHREYKAWLDVVGKCFSPLFPLAAPLRFGPWTSWTVEGLYQGLKLFAIDDAVRIHPLVEFKSFCSDAPSLIHVPAIMAVRSELQQHLLFQLLKSGRKYNSIKNQYFGRLNRKERNWTWTETWRHPTFDIPVQREQFMKEVFVPALSEVLSRHSREVSRLKAYWNDGQHRITSDMRSAHGHLKYVERYVNESGFCHTLVE